MKEVVKLGFNFVILGEWMFSHNGLALYKDPVSGEWEDPANNVAEAGIRICPYTGEPVLSFFSDEEGVTLFFVLSDEGRMRSYRGEREPYYPESTVDIRRFHLNMHRYIQSLA